MARFPVHLGAVAHLLLHIVVEQAKNRQHPGLIFEQIFEFLSDQVGFDAQDAHHRIDIYQTVGGIDGVVSRRRSRFLTITL